MKKIKNAVNILPDDSPSVVSNYKFYGALDTFGEQIGFITREKFGCKNFVFRSPRVFTNGNGWTYFDESDNLADAINKIVANGWDVYEFDTFAELMTWVLKNDPNSSSENDLKKT